MTLPRLHLVTDDAVLARPGFAAQASRLIDRARGPVALHVRGHGTSARDLFHITASLVDAARTHDTLVLVNDRIDVACCADAHGVQLGRRSVAVRQARSLVGDRLIGFSAHDAAGSAMAARDGADFLLIGTVFASGSHGGAPPGGVALIDGTLGAVRIPVIAIGGITPGTVGDVAARGAHGVAVLGGIWNATEPEPALLYYMDAVNAAAWHAVEPVAAHTC